MRVLARDLRPGAIIAGSDVRAIVLTVEQVGDAVYQDDGYRGDVKIRVRCFGSDRYMAWTCWACDDFNLESWVGYRLPDVGELVTVDSVYGAWQGRVCAVVSQGPWNALVDVARPDGSRVRVDTGSLR